MTTLEKERKAHLKIPANLYEKALSFSVRGQAHVIAPISAALRKSEAGFSWEGKPKHSFLFLGPTGVGKTETAKAIAEIIFGERSKLITFDMGAYQTADKVGEFSEIFHTTLEHYQGGAVILFDEIEKGHASITTLLLAILDEGRFTSSKGTLSLAPYYLIFTSNLGCSKLIEMKESEISSIRRFAIGEAQRYFRPEVVARFNTVEVFCLLPLAIQKEICVKFLETYLSQIAKSHGMKCTYEPSVITFLIGVGMDDKLGARPLKNAIERYIGDALSKFPTLPEVGCLTIENQTMKLA